MEEIINKSKNLVYELSGIITNLDDVIKLAENIPEIIDLDKFKDYLKKLANEIKSHSEVLIKFLSE